MPHLTPLRIFLLLALLLAACGGDDDDADDPADTPTAVVSVTGTAGTQGQGTATSPTTATETATAQGQSPSETVTPASDVTATATPGTPTEVPTEAPPVVTDTPESVAQTEFPMRAGCALTAVSAGAAGTRLAPLEACHLPVADWTDLEAGGLVAAGPTGEAWLEFLDEQSQDACGRLYLFHDGQGELQVTPDASTLALQGATALWFNGCGSAVTIATPSADVTLTGSWAAVSYEPSRDLTLVTVFEGEAEVVPVVGDSRRPDGAPQALQAGVFWMTAPQPGEVGGVTLRQPATVDQIGASLNQLGLWEWYSQVLTVVEREEIPSGIQREQLRLTLRGGGVPLGDDLLLQDAILYGVDWANLNGVIFQSLPDWQVDIVPAIGSPEEIFDDGELVSLLSFPWDPDLAVSLNAEAGYSDGYPIVVIVEGEELAGAGAVIVETLTGLGLQVADQVVLATSEDAQRFVDGLFDAQVSWLWLARL